MSYYKDTPPPLPTVTVREAVATIKKVVIKSPQMKKEFAWGPVSDGGSQERRQRTVAPHTVIPEKILAAIPWQETKRGNDHGKTGRVLSGTWSIRDTAVLEEIAQEQHGGVDVNQLRVSKDIAFGLVHALPSMFRSRLRH